MERRTLLKSAIASPIVAAGLVAAETQKQEEPPVEPMFKGQKMMMTFPGKIVSMVYYHDSLIVATEYDGVFQITGE